MRKKRNELFCVLITLFVFISGMYFEDFKVDSVFVCAATQTSNSYMSSVDPVVTDTKACTTEMLGTHENMGLGKVTTRFTYQKRNSKLSRDYLYGTIFFLNVGKSYANCDKVQFVSKNQDDLVVNYIHKSDGKKRI